ncbi:hypothetical protein N7517_003210 [Penicillium concentricum]|uniref:Uncharacterized protein n=1 Tax=Penicillium concentricum TaxID=293559 RepID=A0A9W9VL81_9EURO|nr:uncharacterized protein N7517_003210 [Penicillium concentricum]KAJ5385299.1 hypothetical protein N7517_003210 [Penicillium concentricum]
METIIAHLIQIKVEIPNLNVGCVDRLLYSAARRGYFSIVKTLLDLASRRINPPHYYDTILSYALGGEDYSSDERACSCTKQDVSSGSSEKLLTDHYSTVQLLLDLGARCNYTGNIYSSDMPILLALFKCSSISNGVVKLLVERGANVSSKGVLQGFIETTNQCAFSNEETAKLLLDHGADSSARDYISTTVFNKDNKKALIELLSACGLGPGKINGWDRMKETPEGRAELMKQLLDLDVNIKCRTTFGPTPPQSTISDRSNPYECNLDEDDLNGPDRFGRPISEPEPENPDYGTCDSFIRKSVKLLFSHGADGSIRDSEEQNLLYQTDNKRLVKLILAHGAEVNVVDSYGQTPLLAMTHGASKAMVGTIKLLLKHGANIAAKNADDNTPLHLAVLTSAWEVVELLLDHGADRNSRNQDGETPMDLLARRRSHQEQFSFNRNKKGDLMTFRDQAYRDLCWQWWHACHYSDPIYYCYY